MYICEIDHQGQFYYIYNTKNKILHLWPKALKLKNYLIYNFAIHASSILKPSTHPNIFKLPIMPEMDNIQLPLLELFTWPIRIGYDKIFTGEVYDPDLSRMKLLFILKHLLKMPIQFRN